MDKSENGTTNETFDTLEVSGRVAEMAAALANLNGRHRMKVDGEAFENTVDYLAESQVIADETLTTIKNMGRKLFEYVPRTINPTTGKQVKTIHLLGNEWDITQKFSGENGTKEITKVKLTDGVDVEEIVKVAAAFGVLGEVFEIPRLKVVDVTTLPDAVRDILVSKGYAVTTENVPTVESVSYESPKLINKSGKGKSGKQLATQKKAVGEAVADLLEVQA